MLNLSHHPSISRFLRFCTVGCTNAVIDFGVLSLLLWLFPTQDVRLQLAYNTLAVLLASTNSFIWNKYWTFQQRSPITSQEVSRFAILAGSTTLMNDILMWTLGRLFPAIMASSLIGANILKLGAILGTMSVSFFGMQLWVFVAGRVTRKPELRDYRHLTLPALMTWELETLRLEVAN